MSDPSPEVELVRGRAEIERIDKAIVRLLAERVATGRRIGELKRTAGLPVLNPSREAEVIRAVAEMAREADLPVEPVREIFWRVVALSRQAQEERA
ncbi:MAG: chorismate mutase [Gemmatimonadaceae bacterium]